MKKTYQTLDKYRNILYNAVRINAFLLRLDTIQGEYRL